MWPATALTTLLGIELPIIQAPMAGGITTPELVAAVSNAGGLGFLGAGYMTPAQIKAAITEIKALTKQPFGVNLFVPQLYNATSEQIEVMQNICSNIAAELSTPLAPIQPPYLPIFEEQLAVLFEEKIPVVSFTFGIPAAPILQQLKASGVKVIGTATTVTESFLWAEQAVDAIVAQGAEAGGHRGTFAHPPEQGLMGLMALIPQLTDRLSLPIIAAGGIMDARGIVAALHLGAAGVQMGTAFLSCPEANTSPQYKRALMQAVLDNTVLTRAFSGKLARGIKNKFIDEMKYYEDEILNYPVQNAITKPLRNAAEKQGNTGFMSMWAGQAMYLSKGLPAKDLIHYLDASVKQILR